MADAFGLSDVSSKDTGKGSKLKTGGRRRYNMARIKEGVASADMAKADSIKTGEAVKCPKGEIWNAAVKRCIPAKKKDESFLEWKMKASQPRPEGA